MKTLILDQSFMPITIVHWTKAFCLVLREKAEVIHYYKDKVVRSVSQKFEVPQIIKINKSITKFLGRTPLTSDNIFKRDNYKCAYCGNRFKREDLTIDHIIPKCQGGDVKSWENMTSSCGACNGKKGGRTPDQANMKLLHKAEPPKWCPWTYLKLSQNEVMELKNLLGIPT